MEQVYVALFCCHIEQHGVVRICLFWGRTQDHHRKTLQSPKEEGKEYALISWLAALVGEKIAE